GPQDDPCLITRPVKVTGNRALDFGVRSVLVSRAGRFDFGADGGAIRCGSLLAYSSRRRLIKAFGATDEGPQSGDIEILARRSCSLAARPCSVEYDCHLGPCDARRCSLRSSWVCAQDADCTLGVCQPTRRCSANDRVRCLSDSDCNLGVCGAQLVCRASGAQPVACGEDSDCEFGSCSVGEARIDLGGGINGRSTIPGLISIEAVGDITLRRTIDVSGTAVGGDGGSVSVNSSAGNVSVLGKIDCTGSYGGELGIRAAGNIATGGPLRCNGGDGSAGYIEIRAGGDISIGNDVTANGITYAGAGGEILVHAEGNLAVERGSFEDPVRIGADGADGPPDSENGGDGGIVDLSAHGNGLVGRHARITANAGTTYGTAGEIYIDVGGSLAFAGSIDASGAGPEGGWGAVSLNAGDAISVEDSASIRLHSGDLSDAGELYVGSWHGDLTLRGGIIVEGGSGRGPFHPALGVEACRIRTEAGSSLFSSARGATTRLIAHESMTLGAGAGIRSKYGTNVLRYRDAAKPPVVLSSVSPAPTIEVDSGMAGCPVCGNGEVDEGEQCDDGDTIADDQCSADCLLAAFASTPN
ncbi:MAG: hypothetical protein HY899_13215, partial [Deltaproteobacteria bacterium]|nr:hypothetical protein [Deltaproteobacteria bacterium]